MSQIHDIAKNSKTMKRLLAIDPGASGGFAWHAESTTRCCPMPATEGDVLDHLTTIISAQNIHEAYIEEVGGYCGAALPGSAMFNFGRNFGFILGVLAARGIRVNLVRPQKWQKYFGLGTVKATGGKTAWKNKLKQKAQQLFPNADVTLKVADALLIYEYGQRQP
jgi:hypothetical protein